MKFVDVIYLFIVDKVVISCDFSPWGFPKSVVDFVGSLEVGGITISYYYGWWKKSGVYQLRLVVYPIIYRVSYMSGGAGFLPSTGVFHSTRCWSSSFLVAFRAL